MELVSRALDTKVIRLRRNTLDFIPSWDRFPSFSSTRQAACRLGGQCTLLQHLEACTAAIGRARAFAPFASKKAYCSAWPSALNRGTRVWEVKAWPTSDKDSSSTPGQAPRRPGFTSRNDRTGPKRPESSELAGMPADLRQDERPAAKATCEPTTCKASLWC